MKKSRIMAVPVLIAGSSLALSLSQQPGADRATAATAGSTHGATARETITAAEAFTPGVWVNAFEEDSMKALKRVTCRATFRSEIMSFAR